MANRVIAIAVRPFRAMVSSRLGSTALPVACIGETTSTRREPAQEASQVVRTTVTIGRMRIGSITT